MYYKSPTVNADHGKEMSSGFREAMRKIFLAYLKSDTWARVRINVLFRDGKKCRRCHGIGNVVHHISYLNWGKGNVEEVMDCMLLCDECHEKEHMEKRIDVPFFAKKDYKSVYREGEVIWPSQD